MNKPPTPTTAEYEALLKRLDDVTELERAAFQTKVMTAMRELYNASFEKIKDKPDLNLPLAIRLNAMLLSCSVAMSRHLLSCVDPSYVPFVLQCLEYHSERYASVFAPPDKPGTDPTEKGKTPMTVPGPKVKLKN